MRKFYLIIVVGLLLVLTSCSKTHITISMDDYVIREAVVLDEDGNVDHDKMQNIFGANIRRDQVASVTFRTNSNKYTKGYSKKNYVDISLSQANRLKMYYKQHNDTELFDILVVGRDIKLPTNASYLLYNLTNVKDIDFSRGIDTHRTENLSYMFYNSTITDINLIHFDNLAFINYDYMFSKTHLSEVNLVKFFNIVVPPFSAEGMFNDCPYLRVIDISGFYSITKPPKTFIDNTPVLETVYVMNKYMKDMILKFNENINVQIKQI
ncbi:MAG: hypothetical protein ACRC5M_02945 [Anaeroplasmataceae bacterium]